MPPTPQSAQARYRNMYQDAYLMSHQQRLEYSFNLAQQELKTKMQLIEFYEKRASDLKKANTGSEFSQLVTFYKLEHSVDKQIQDRLDKEARAVEGAFDISRVDVTGLGEAMRADMRSGSSGNKALTRSLSTVGQVGSSELQRIVIGKALFAQAASQAKSLSKPFDASKARTDIGTSLGITPAKMLMSDTDLKMDEYEARTKKIGRTVSGDDLRDLKGKIAADNAKGDAYSDKADALMNTISETYGDEINLENLVERGREIYTNQFAPMSKQDKESYAQQQVIQSLSPKAKLIYSGLSGLDPKDKRIGALSIDSEDTVIRLAAQILEEKKTGRDTNMIQFARDFAKREGVAEDDIQEVIETGFGLAFRTYAAEQPKATTRLEDRAAKLEKLKEIETDERDPLVEEAKQGAFSELLNKLQGGVDMGGFDELFSNRITRKVNPNTERVIQEDEIPSREDVEFDESGGQPLNGQPSRADVEFDESGGIQTSIPTAVDSVNPLYLPIGTNVVDKNTYNYQITGYNTDNKPAFVFVGKDGNPIPTKKLNQAMLDEALKGYEVKTKELEK